MGYIIPIIFIVAIIGGLGFMAYDNTTYSVQKPMSQARELIESFGQSGEIIAFDLAPQAPLTEFIYEKVEKIIVQSLTNQQLTDIMNQVPDGEFKTYLKTFTQVELKSYFGSIQDKLEPTVEEKSIIQIMNEQKASYSKSQVVTEIKKIPVSEISLEITSRQTGQKRIVFRGDQTDITGRIIMTDPNTGADLAPPYGFLMTIDCINSIEAVLSCANFNQIVHNSLTFGDRTFKYTWATDQNDPLGEYVAYVRVTSKWLDSSNRPIVREMSLPMELIER